MILAQILLSLMLTPQAEAAKIIGNGGDVLVCPGQVPRVRLLDFAEVQLRPSSVRLTDPGGSTYREKLDNLLGKIGRRFPRLAQELRQEVRFFEDNKSLVNVELEDIPDSYHKLRMPGCHIQQAVNQSEPLFVGEPWYIIQAALWDGLSEFEKAGMVLHEVIYRKGLQYSLEHSIGVRYLVALFFHDRYEDITDQRWVDAFRHSRLKIYEMAGYEVPLFYGKPARCNNVPGTTRCANGVPYFVEHHLSFDFYQRLRSVRFRSGFDRVRWRSGEFEVVFRTDQIHFDWSGNEGLEMVGQGNLTILDSSRAKSFMGNAKGRFRHQAFKGVYQFDGGPEIAFEDSMAELFESRKPIPLTVPRR